MSKIDWTDSPKEYSTGVDRGVFYNSSRVGYPWVGLTNVRETIENDTFAPRYQNGVRYHNSARASDFSGTITAYSHPKNFFDDPLTLSKRKEFGFCYRTNRLNGYELHIVYNVLVKPPKRNYAYKNPDTIEWEFSTRPMVIPGVRPSAHLVLNSSKMDSYILAEIEDSLYGTEETDAVLLTPTEIYERISDNLKLRVIDFGNGIWQAIGPDSMFEIDEENQSFSIDSSSASYISSDTYTIESL